MPGPHDRDISSDLARRLWLYLKWFHQITPHLWKVLDTSSTLGSITSHPTEIAYPKALAEAYSHVTSWDTQQQMLSVKARVASFEAMSEFIPVHHYTVTNQHQVQYGWNALVTTKEFQRMRIDPKQLNHFWGFIASPHLVQDVLFGEKHLQLSPGKAICAKHHMHNDTWTDCDKCSALARKSLHGLDYFARWHVGQSIR